MPTKTRPKRNLSAMKRVRQAEKRRLRNKSVKSYLKTISKKVENAISIGNKEEATRILKEAIKAHMRAASKGIIHKNSASRKISRLTKKVNALLAA